MGWLIGKQFPIASVMCKNGVQEACDLVRNIEKYSQSEAQKKFGELISNPTFRALGEGSYEKNGEKISSSLQDVDSELGIVNENAYKEKMNAMPKQVKGRMQVDVGSINKRRGIKKMTEKDIKDLSLKLGYDAPEISQFVRQVEINAKTRATMTADGQWIEKNIPNGDVEGRKRFHQEKIAEFWEKQINARPIQYNKQIAIVLGMPGAGKSSQVADQIIEQIGGVLIDADEFKDMLPEYREDGSMVSAIHEESSMMTKQFTKEVIEKGANAVWPMVGASNQSLRKKIEQLKRAGYNVTLVNANVSMETAMDRNLSRYWQLVWGRLQDPSAKKARIINPKLYAQNDNFSINEVYEDMINNPDLVDSFAEVDIENSPPEIGYKSDDFNFTLGKPFKDIPERAEFVRQKKNQYKVNMKRVR